MKNKLEIKTKPYKLLIGSIRRPLSKQMIKLILEHANSLNTDRTANQIHHIILIASLAKSAERELDKPITKTRRKSK